MNAYFDTQLLSIFERDGVDITLNHNREIDDSDSMVATKKALVDISLTHFQSTTSHVCLANSFDLLYAILLAQLVKSIVNLIQ